MFAAMDEEISNGNYITAARQFSTNGNYCKSFEMFILFFEKEPQAKVIFEEEFRQVLIKLNELLATRDKMSDIFMNFGRAIAFFPHNSCLLNDIGKYLYKYGYYTEAWCHFQKALKLDSGFVNAEKNLNSVKNLMVERWHFRMLNDTIRNEAYCKAIRETVIPKGDRVLDVGAGTGLLSLYASDCSPAATTACEGSETMANLADNILKENQKNKIHLIRKMSTDIYNGEMGGKCSLLVTEMFDAGLFGEHVLQMLVHAREHLITDFAQVIPNKAEFFVIGAQCGHLNMKYQLCESSKTLLNMPTYNVHVLTSDETYDCEDVHLFKDLKYITEPKSLLKIDFNNINDIKDVLDRNEPYSVELKANIKGEINTVIGWFNLYLSKNVTISTDPRSEIRANAWQQAVFFDIIPKNVEENVTLNVKFIANGGKLKMLPEHNSRIMRVSPETLRFLNDSEYIKMITKCLGMASVYLGQMTDMSHINIVDLCPFPVFGFLMLKRGAQSVTCYAKTKDDKKFLKKVLKVNKIPSSKINVLVGDDWSQDVFRNKKYHAIFCNILELCGEIDFRLSDVAQHLKVGHLVPGGLFMPANISIVGQVVCSDWLDINNRVYDKNVNNYKMAMYLNRFQVSQNFCIDFSRLEYTPLTEPVVLGNYINGMNSDVVNVQILNEGTANAILCWYNIEMLDKMGEIPTNRVDSFIDGMAFLANPPVQMVRGNDANILYCIDSDGAFKLMIDTEST